MTEHWTTDPDHPNWDTPVGYSHAAILASLSLSEQV